MSSLLRHGETAHVLDLAAPPISPSVDPTLLAVEEELAAQRRANTELREEMAEAIAASAAEARKEALAAYRRNDDKALAALEDGIGRALGGWADALSRLEVLSLQFTKGALEKAFADDVANACETAIMRQVQTLRRESILCVRVSPLDFPDQAQLQQLANRIGGSCDVQHDEALQRGDCHIDLRLGRVELSLAQYWWDLAAALDELIAAESAT